MMMLLFLHTNAALRRPSVEQTPLSVSLSMCIYIYCIDIYSIDIYIYNFRSPEWAHSAWRLHSPRFPTSMSTLLLTSPDRRVLHLACKVQSPKGLGFRV